MAAEARVFVGELSGVPEKSEIKRVRLSRRGLMSGNFAFRALDRDRLVKMQGDKFDRDRYNNQLPEIVRVADPDSPEGWRYKPLDGHHRIASHPDDEINLLDITDRLIESRYPEQQSLTSLQFLEEVRDPTEAQVRISGDRMALHFLTEWRGIINNAVSDSSGLAALVLLGIPDFYNESEKTVQKYFVKNPTRAIFDEDHESRPVIIAGLLGLSHDIAETKKGYDTFALSAFQAVASLTDSDEDRSVQQRQIEGLFTIPEVMRKVTESVEDDAMIPDKRDGLYSLLSTAIPATAEYIHENTALREALLDTHLSYDHLGEVLTPPETDYKHEAGQSDLRSLSVRYDDVRRRINRTNLIEAYASRHEGSFPSGESAQVMGNLTRREVLNATEIADIVFAGNEAAGVIGLIDARIEQLGSNINTSFSKMEISQWVRLLNDSRGSILRTQRLQSLSSLLANAKKLFGTIDTAATIRTSAAGHEGTIVLDNGNGVGNGTRGGDHPRRSSARAGQDLQPAVEVRVGEAVTLRAKVEEQTGEIAGLRDAAAHHAEELSARDTRITSLEDIVQRQSAANTALTEKNERLTGELATKGQIVSDLTAKVDSEPQGVDERIRGLEETVEMRDGELAKRDQRIAELGENVHDLVTRLQGADETIVAQRGLLSANKAKIDGLERTVGERDRTIASKDGEIEMLKAEQKREEGSGINGGKIDVQVEIGEGEETVVVSPADYQRLVTQAAEAEALRATQSWWENPELELSQFELAVVKANAKGRRRKFLAVNTGATAAMYDQALERVFARLERHEATQAATSS